MLGVVIPHHSNRTHLARAVASVRGFTTVVVDDSLGGGISLDGAHVLRTAGLQGFARAANAGLDRVHQMGLPLALVLNDDAQMRPGATAALLDAWLQTDGAISPVLFERHGPVYGIAVSRWGRVRLNHEPQPLQALSGASILMRSTERFDPLYVHGFEDIELCRRLRDRGLALRVIEESQCDHLGGGSVDRRSREAQRAAIAGHLRYLGGGVRGGVAVGLGVAQVLAEGGPSDRFLGILDGIRDHIRGRPHSEC